MNGTEIFIGVIIGCIAILFVVIITYIVLTIIISKSHMYQKLFLGKLVNSDCYMNESMQHLSLTNGIKDNYK